MPITAQSFRSGFRKKNVPKRFIRINYRIQAPQVRLIDEKGNQVGIVSRDEAIIKAKEARLDLVEIVPGATPPVCRIIDFHKYQYEQNKREREARRKQHTVEQKEIRLSPVISEHDYNFKKEHIVRFLKAGDRVKVSVRFRGRQILHREKGREILERLTKELSEIAAVERNARFEGRQIDIIFRPV